MSMEMLILMVCFLGALVQTTTGLGFGLIVAPMLLAFHEPVDAIQITGTLTLILAGVITPFVRGHIVPKELAGLATGSGIGLLLGSGLLLVLPITGIRLAALVALGYSLVRYVNALMRSAAPTAPEEMQPSRCLAGLMYGMGSGAMSATLAMPGPLALIFLRSRGHAPDRVRATVFALMVGSYSGMLIISVLLSGLSQNVLDNVVFYLAPTLGGLVVGQFLVNRLPTLLFDLITTLLMLSTLAVLGLKIVNADF
jgi:uncharacterized membrane protein YfcA